MSRFALALLLALSACAVSSQPPPAVVAALTPAPEPEPEPVPIEDVPDMAQQADYAARGLYTLSNQFSEVPDGAFSKADDVVIRREGIVETRRGFKPASGTLPGAASVRADAMHDIAGTLVAHTSANTLARFDGTAWTAYSGTYAPPSGRKTRFLQTAKSLYFTTSTGVKRLDTATGTPMAAGVPQAVGGTVALANSGAHATGTVTLGGGAGNVTITVGGTAVVTNFATSDTVTATNAAANLNANATVAALVRATSLGTVITLRAVNGGTGGNAITLTSTRTAGTAVASGATLTGGTAGGGFLLGNNQTAYRFVWGIRNDNDRIILGAPSGRLPLTNAATETSANVTVTVRIPSWVTSSHFLQVYRADASGTDSVPASDDMALIYETYPTTGQITARSLTFTDLTPDELKGAPLYSSPNAGIAGSEKFQPPVCVDIAEYKGRMWCAATTQRQRLLLTLVSVDATSGGMDDGDQLRIDLGAVVEAYAAGATYDPGMNQFARFTDGTAAQNVANTAQSLVQVINERSTTFVALYVSGEYDSPGQILIETRELGSAEFTVSGINSGPYWAPALPSFFTTTQLGRTAGTVTVNTAFPHRLSVGQSVEMLSGDASFPAGVKTIINVPVANVFVYTEAGPDVAPTLTTRSWTTVTPAITSDPEDAPDGIAYAEFGEPDAVPLGNYTSVGSPNYATLRILPLGSTLFILKEDGTFTLTGDSPETFNVQAFPTPAKLLAPDSAVVVGNAIYGLTDQGVVRITENGAEVVSRPIEDALLPLYSGDAAMRATVKAHAFGVGYETEREYWLFLPESVSDTSATQAYVYNYATRTWVRWTVDALAGHVLPSSDTAYLSSPSSNTVNVERKTRTTADYQDADGVAIPSAVRWSVRTGKDPSAYKMWQKMTTYFETPSPTSIGVRITTERDEVTGGTAGTLTTDGLPYVWTYIPEEQCRSQVLRIEVSAGEVAKKLAIAGLTVDYFPSGTKLR